MYFSLNISLIVIVLLSLAAVLSLIYVLWQWSRTWRLQRFVKGSEAKRAYVETLPPVTVIVDACTETMNLEQIIQLIMEQDYPEFEVIVVANSNSDWVDNVLSEMKARYDNLRITFSPRETRALSRKKLALMIGYKSAMYDIVVSTCANCRPMSTLWLATIARNFVEGTDVVLGYSHYRYNRDKQSGHAYRVFDSVTTGVQWLVRAIGNRTFRGTSENMAFRKQLFFDNNGYADSMHLIWGEDDVFLKKIVTKTNTRVELAPESDVQTYFEDYEFAHTSMKMHRDFTTRLVSWTAPLAQGVLSSCYWLRLLLAVAAIVLDYRNVLVVAAAVLLVILSSVFSAMSFGRNCRLLHAPRFPMLVPFFTLVRPLVNLKYRIKEARHRSSNYTSMFS